MVEEISSPLSESFIEQIKQALAHLYNFSFLQKLPIALEVSAAQQEHETAGHYLRRALMQCIEALNPGRDVFFRSPDGRVYHLLKLHYIDRMTLQESAHELGVSERQVYRDLRQGQLNVAELFWNKHFVTPPETSMQHEFERLKDNVKALYLADLVVAAQNAVQRLATQYHTLFTVEMLEMPVLIKTNVTIAQQLLISLLSYSIKQAQEHGVRLTLTHQNMQPRLHLHCLRHPQATAVPLSTTPILQLVEQINWEMAYQETQDEISVTLTIKGNDFTLLAIDDNEGLGELLTRYLAGYNCHLVACSNSIKGLALARETFPSVIFLDVMMPDIDGWEVLQRLRTYPETQNIPVVICSILHDPELAYSLGASHVLAKPITREKLVEAIHALALV